jgi:IS30 family transposase
MVMSTGQRFRLTAAERQDMWQRWRRGERISEIAKCMDRAMGSIQDWIGEAGGFEPYVPRRAIRTLSLSEREDISRGLAAGDGIREIGRRLGRSPSTISREIARNGGARHYRASRADTAAYERAKRPQRCLLDQRPRLARAVASKLKLCWAPQQIAGWLKREHPDDASMTVSHETIYRTLFVQARGALKKELTAYLREHTRMRRPRNQKPAGTRYHIKDAVSISERPAQAEDRAVPGHWEGDLLFGTVNSQVATLVERRSRYLMIVKVAGKDTASVVDALTRRIKRLPQGLMSTLTWDRGSEMAAHKRFSIDTDVKVYFCDPYSPWQRGSNENTNRLLRQYMPKGMDFAELTQAKLDRIAAEMNGRPRKTLGYACPAEVFSETVATTS